MPELEGTGVIEQTLDDLEEDSDVSTNQIIKSLMTSEDLEVKCMPAGTIILGDNKSVEEYVAGDRVLGQNGLVDVQSQNAIAFDGKLVEVKAQGCIPFIVTPNHPLLVKTIIHRKGKTTSVSVAAWKRADALDSDDYALIPRLKGIYETTILSLLPYVRTGNGQAGRPPKLYNLPLTSETAWLMGLYVAEGCQGMNGKCIVLYLNENERNTVAKRACDIITRLGFKPKIYQDNRFHGISIHFGSVTLVRAFEEWFGRGALNKQVPEWILLHKDPNITGSFLKGYEEGDGAIINNEMICGTVSKVLAQQIQLIGARFGVFYQINFNKLKPSTINGRKITPNSQGGQYLLSRTLNGTIYRRSKYFIDADSIVVPIRKIGFVPFKGLVYNVVTQDHTILISNLTTHQTHITNPLAQSTLDMIGKYFSKITQQQLTMDDLGNFVTDWARWFRLNMVSYDRLSRKEVVQAVTSRPEESENFSKTLLEKAIGSRQ